MQRYLAATAAAAIMCGAALADASAQSRGRTGGHGISGKVDACVQASSNNVCVIDQNSNNNVAGSVQSGNNNETLIRQRGGKNQARTQQRGR